MLDQKSLRTDFVAVHLTPDLLYVHVEVVPAYVSIALKILVFQLQY